MANLSIKTFPADLMASLKVEAARRRLTLREYIIRRLSEPEAVAIPPAASEPMRRALRDVQHVFAELERDTLVRRLHESRQRTKAKHGRCEGQKPFGHYQGEAPVLAQIRDMRDSGMPCHQIAAALDSMAIPTRSGRSWSRAVVAKILRRETVAPLPN